MDADALAASVLGMLRADDLETLLNLSFRRAFERGDLVVAAGEEVDRFYLVEEGSLRVEEEPPAEPRYLRPGQVFGSTSLHLVRPSPYNVVAHEDVIAIALTPDQIDWLTEAEPVVAARLMKALAAALAGRNHTLALGAGAQPQPAAAVDQPSALTRFAEACRECRRTLEAMGPAPEDGASFWARERIPAVSTAYRPVLRALAGLMEGAPPTERARYAQLARNELLELAGTSRLVERMNARPTGKSAGYRGFNHIYRNVPEGDDAVGLLTDAWLLTRPFAEAIRERRTAATERVTREVLDRARPDRIVRILSLGCGPARSLADILEEPGMAEKISVTCVDDDQEALVHANNLLKGRAPRGDITFRQVAPAALTPDADGFGDYDVIASLYTADNSDLASLGRVLYIAQRWLRPNGVVEFVVFGDAVPDWLLLDALLDWRPQRCGLRELQDAVARSPFGQAGSDVAPTPSGLNIFVRAIQRA